MKKTSIYNLIVILAVAFCAIFGFILSGSFSQNKALEQVVFSELAKNKVSDKDLAGKVKHVYIERRYRVPDSFAFEEFDARLERSLEKAGFQLLAKSRSSRETRLKGKKESIEEISYLISERSSGVPLFRLTLIHRIPYLPPVKVPAAKVPLPTAKAKPKIAVVLDDWGYNKKNLNDVLQIEGPLTLSVLPGLPYSTLIANKAKEHNFEVILHMPMEPKAKMKLEMTTLSTAMSEDEIRSSLAKALQTVPHADGVSNHEGSKATEDERLMRVVFGELKRYNMFFLDSFVTSKSVGERLAAAMKVRFAKRTIFLDNESDPGYIRKQFENLIDIALRNGSAIGIGHDRPNTVAVLKEVLPKLDERGVELTYLSNLAR